ncbi:hypothetical protein BC936DRAFT_137459 [Jimgerdemannia flammicorona]|uniref:Ion transport domain-containing protein n=1 Tax=Jimgerdemannia flammicorona TaxID=994334 RepID=A0A433DJ64_9FUNG|nr:hypothetical protein BC936DRAFT_137459 [Jimgerdemannia flammicorona]
MLPPDTMIINTGSTVGSTVPTKNNSTILFNIDESIHSTEQVHYFKGDAVISDDFYFEIFLDREHMPSSVWLGYVNEKWSSSDFDATAATWSWEPMTGFLKYEGLLYAHDPSSTNIDITIGFGVKKFKDDGEDCWSFVRREQLPKDLYPAIRLMQSSPTLRINSSTPFYHQGSPFSCSPHQAPIEHSQCSQDYRYAACFSPKDCVLSVWRLLEPVPELIEHISVPEFKATAQRCSPEDLKNMFTIAISNTDGEEKPQIVLSRYNAKGVDGQILFLNYGRANRPIKPETIVGKIDTLGDGSTLLILGAERLFLVNMKTRSLLRIFDVKDLDIRPPIAAPEEKRFMRTIGLEHFIWHHNLDHLTMWHAPTGRLEQTFRFTPQDDLKVDYDNSLPAAPASTSSLKEQDLKENLIFQRKPDQPTERKLEIVQLFEGSPFDVNITSEDKLATMILEPWSRSPPICHCVSEDWFVFFGLHTVQVIDAASTTQKYAIKLGWCLPSKKAKFTSIKLKSDDNGSLQEIVIEYDYGGETHRETVKVPMEPPISVKHASRFIQFAGEDDKDARVIKMCRKVLKLAPNEVNEVEFETKTSILSHIALGPLEDAGTLVRKALEDNIYRPRFHDNLWTSSTLVDMLDDGRFEIAVNIVKYCLNGLSPGNKELELGYIAIVMAALPVIAESKPNMSILIAQYVSNVELSRFLGEGNIDARKRRNDVFARVEQLYSVVPFLKLWGDKQLLLLEWWRANVVRPYREWWELLPLEWWHEERHPHPVRLCVSPLYGLNRYPEYASSCNLSPFVQLAFRQSPVFHEPAFKAVIDHKWNTFARYYYFVILILYISYATLYLVAVSFRPSKLSEPSIKYTILVLSAVFLAIFDIRQMRVRWNSRTYWSSFYPWIDRTAFVLVFVSTILSSPDYDQAINLQAWTALTLWLFVVFNFRVFQGFGLFFTVLVQILSSVGWLVFIMTMVIFAFAHAAWILAQLPNAPDTNNPFLSFENSLNAFWQFLCGDFALTDAWDAGNAKRSLNIMRVLFTSVSTIVLLNVLIAILNNVYTDSQETAKKTWLRNRAEFIAMVEVFMLTPAQRQNRNWFPAVVFYEVVPDDFGKYEEDVKSKHPWIKSTGLQDHGN